MTRRTFNYTGRQRIPQKLISVVLGRDKRFDASWDLSSFGFEGHARVYLEAISTRSGSPVVLRFPYGTIGAPVIPADRSVESVAAGNFAFNLKVVDESQEHGRLLGIAEGIRPIGEGEEDDAAKQEPLLPVVPTDLGSDVWRLSFAFERPRLEVNNRIADIMARIRSDELFFALTYPCIVREVLFRILVIEEMTDPDGGAEDWRVRWLRWAIHWHPEHERPDEGTWDDNAEQWTNWINTVVSSFCNIHDAAGKYGRRSEGGE